MPSHTVASALIKLYFADQSSPSPLGHPWGWPVWQDITGVKHGLFPSDDKLLPKGLSREDVEDIRSYFKSYHALDSEEKKIKFAVNSKGASAIPGRKKWATFVTKRWDSWKVHSKIVQCLHQTGIHPVTILLNEGSLDGEWPAADLYLPIALESIALTLFGPEAFGDDKNGQGLLLPVALRKPLTAIVVRSWDRIRRHISRDKGRIIQIEEAAQKAFDGVHT